MIQRAATGKEAAVKEQQQWSTRYTPLLYDSATAAAGRRAAISAPWTQADHAPAAPTSYTVRTAVDSS